MSSKFEVPIWLTITSVWLTLMAFGAPALPAVMRILDLQHGLWSHRPSRLESQTLKGLVRPVHVAWDRSGVPHFFAESEEDLYLVQGFVMASQRLFQMDAVTRQAAGRLSEWAGERTLRLDRFFIKLGMRESAEKTLGEFSSRPEIARMLDRFAQGVNAYIDQMVELPPEYVVLGKTPRRLTPLDVIYMDKSLTFNLAGRSLAIKLSQLQQKIGTKKVLDLFPEFLPNEFEDYIIPENGHFVSRSREVESDFRFVTQLKNIPEFPLANPSNGSNNWAVGPAKSSTGHSIVANDTHLGYTLPNIWYENQLWTPDFNVYGVSLTAVPGLVAGLNRKVAWATTNGTTQVLDWYQIEFESGDERSLRYRYRGRWEQAETRLEKLESGDGSIEEVQVVKTKLGYLLHREGRFGLVADWMGHRSNQELQGLRGLYTAADYRDCQKSLRLWAVPIQNFICADADHIAIRHTGRIPRRRVGDGRFVMDGSTAEGSFLETFPREDEPNLENPDYVLSANQKVLSRSWGQYLGWDYEEPFRGMMIRRNLEAKAKLTPDDMMRIQNDDYDLQAAYILPYLIKAVDRARLSEKQVLWIDRLAHWSYNARADRVEPTIFKAWYDAFRAELFDSIQAEPSAPFYPKSMRIAWLLKRIAADPADPDGKWLPSSPRECITGSFGKAWERLAREFGPDPDGWTWARWMRSVIPHIGRLPGFGSELLEMAGSGQSVRGHRGRHGPVYKAVFALGDQPRAWMQVPGGNSGDPLSPDYERFVRDWSEGKMREVEFYSDLADARSRGADRVIELSPAGGS